MSMREYSVQAYGLLAYPKDLQAWWDRETEGCGTDDFEQEEVPLCEVSECLPEDGCATCVYDNSGDVYHIDDKGIADLDDTMSKPGDDFVILELDKDPNLFKAVYQNRQEAIDELREHFAYVLPCDFDFENRFVYYTGCDVG